MRTFEEKIAAMEARGIGKRLTEAQREAVKYPLQRNTDRMTAGAEEAGQRVRRFFDENGKEFMKGLGLPCDHLP